MALVHNMALRGLNSIYLQAQHVVKADEVSFCKYILVWHLMLHHHHSTEEEELFPAIEELLGEKRAMAANVEQHHAFHAGLEALVAYVQDCEAGKQKYSGDRIVALIDDFGEILAGHLADEITFFLGLKRFGADKTKGIPKLLDETGEKAMVGTNLSVTFSAVDVLLQEIIWPYVSPPMGLCECRQGVRGWAMEGMAAGARSH
jgi:hypothetical protein